MGLLDALFSNDTGGGLLSGLPSSWQWQNPKEQQQQINYDPMGNVTGTTIPPDIFGGIPAAAPAPPPPSIFDQRSAPPIFGSPQPGPMLGSFTPPSQPSQPATPPQNIATPAPPPQPQDGPINNMNIGGYQMPQFGSAADYTPQQATIPQNVRAAQAQAPQPTPQDRPQQLPSFLSNQGGLGAGLQGFANNLHTGPIGALVGGIGSAFGMQNPAQQNLKAQFDAVKQTLIDSGESENAARSKAMLAVMNPEAGKTILTEALTNKQKYGVINEDPLSGKQYGFYNERDQTVNGKPIAQGGTSPEGQSSGLQGMTDKITSMRTQGATKEQMLAQIPTGYRDDVASLIDGKAVPANLGRSQLRGPLLTLAKVIDPSFDETLIPARVQMRKDFSGEGKNGQAIGALNTVQHHAGQLSDAIEEFDKAGGGGNWPVINGLKLALANNTSYDPKLRDAAQKLNDKLNATEHEVASAYNAGHITDADRKTWNDIKASNLPADQLRQKLADFDELLAGKRDSLNHMYQTMFHTDAPTIDRKANEETSAKIHSRLPDRNASITAPTIGTVKQGYKFTGGDPANPSSWQKQ